MRIGERCLVAVVAFVADTGDRAAEQLVRSTSGQPQLRATLPDVLRAPKSGDMRRGSWRDPPKLRMATRRCGQITGADARAQFTEAIGSSDRRR
jgi:hypothetical protein